ncbi:MAG: AmmeMemoRadiSam system radical SAM enzyme [Verrucomicrobia bacterium]|nr:AmmeMemoRadiSam system radical SAM enzyme [Verrucomicrobiota bacterium]
MMVQCDLCPKQCVIKPGQSGDCRIRVNIDGKLHAVTYGHPSSVHIDPVEKKPLNHFLPGTSILSIATVGCNLHCKNCQNWEISQRNPEDSSAISLPPEAMPEVARRYGCLSVAYTYTDPSVYYEYALDSCIKVKEAGLRNVLVTAGYMNEKPMRELYQHVDAANIDLKSMSDKFYQSNCSATLQPVLNTLVNAKSMGVMVEVTSLLIPTLNDTDEEIGELCKWIVENMGKDTPLHFSRFHPQYRMRHLPPTPEDTLIRAREIARQSGLYYAYIGNILIEDSATTYCPGCGVELVRRRGYEVLMNKLQDGKCPDCDTEIYGIWL